MRYLAPSLVSSETTLRHHFKKNTGQHDTAREPNSHPQKTQRWRWTFLSPWESGTEARSWRRPLRAEVCCMKTSAEPVKKRSVFVGAKRRMGPPRVARGRGRNKNKARAARPILDFQGLQTHSPCVSPFSRHAISGAFPRQFRDNPEAPFQKKHKSA